MYTKGQVSRLQVLKTALSRQPTPQAHVVKIFPTPETDAFVCPTFNVAKPDRRPPPVHRYNTQSKRKPLSHNAYEFLPRIRDDSARSSVYVALASVGPHSLNIYVQ